jgi:type IV pilus assembly protein PilB
MNALAAGPGSRTEPPMSQVGGSSIPPTHRLGDLLLEARLATAEQIDIALAAQSTRRRRLGEILREDGVLDDTTLAAVLSVQLDAPLVDLREHPSDDDALRAINEADARRLTILPLALRDTRLFVATEDPGDRASLEEAARLSGRRIEPLLAFRSEIQDAIPRRYRVTGDLAVQVSAFASRKPESAGPAAARERDAALVDLSAAPVVQIVNLLVTQALRDRASDLHLEPQLRGLRVRARVDGILRDVVELPADLAPGLVSRIKILAELNIVEKQRAQDGQITLDIEGRPVDIRVATMRTMWGEKVVLRLLDRARTFRRLDQLGFPPTVHPAFRSLLDSTFGMVVVAGPTGSGKTTTLYASMGCLDGNKLNISTVEDPIEYHLSVANQVQVHDKIGMSFSAALRSLLRQDPDVVMLGEIRDPETARIAVQASLTGHLVLSTLHTNDAPSSVTRLINIGVEPYLISAAVNAILAQRLVRKICQNCKEKYHPSDEMREFLTLQGFDPDQTYKGAGCDKCRKTGYSGRCGIHELLVMDDSLRDMVTRNPDVTHLRKLCRERGLVTLRQDGFAKALKGLTTIEEIMRVTENAT